jgi:hypothetical protein
LRSAPFQRFSPRLHRLYAVETCESC